MENFIQTHVVPFAKNFVFALIVLIVGIIAIRLLTKHLPKSKLFQKIEDSAASFILSTIKILLYAFLIIILISILGVPMASIIAALTSAFLAIGLALQGALSNFAGGIMILLFKPFQVGDYITCSGGAGTVKEISVIYTSILTDDNNRITVPNGTLMNDSVVNHTVEGRRRVDIKFSVAYGTDEKAVESELISLVSSDTRVHNVPDVELKTTGYLDNGIQYALRMWCDAENYWAVYFDYMEKTKDVLSQLGVSAPTSKVSFEMNK